MPSHPAPLMITIRPPGRAPYALSLDRLTEHLRAARLLMGISRDELKAKRLAAMGAVGAEMDASAAMYDRVVGARQLVVAQREKAEAAHMGALSAEIADLKEMADEMAEFAQAAPPTSQAGTASGAQPTVKPSNASAALAALQASVPQPDKMNLVLETPYDGTHPPGTEGPK